VALKSDAAAEKSKDQLSRHFWFRSFSIFATVSATSGYPRPKKPPPKGGFAISKLMIADRVAA
jgi:hypothetical protein